MNIVEKIKTFLQQAEVYRSQGLLDESKESYENAVKLIEANRNIKGADSLLEKITDKLKRLQETAEKIKQASTAPEMTEAVQNLIKEKFAFAADENEKAFEGAMALFKFGQSERAIKEFEKLLPMDSHRMAAAKNIVRCFLSLDSVDKMISEYEQWVSNDTFSQEELDNLRTFIEGFLFKKGIDRTLPEVVGPLQMEVPENTTGQASLPETALPPIEISGIEMAEVDEEGVNEEDLTDVSSIGITLVESAKKKRLVELEVNLVKSIELTVVVSRKQKELTDMLKTGTKLDNVQFYTPFAMFTGACVVKSNTKIGTGPKRGDFSIDLRVVTG